MSSHLNVSNSLPDGVDLTNCEREPIRVPGSIQPHGMLLVVDAEHLELIQASENTLQFLGQPAEEMLGERLENVIGPDAGHQLRTDLQSQTVGSRPQLLRTLTVDSPDGPIRVHVIVHRLDTQLVLEFERASDVDPGSAIPDVYSQVDAFTLAAEDCDSVEALCGMTAESVRRLTDFDRVLIYRFDDDWHGTVIGESGNGKFPSLLHHRFPASDIPAQARELYRTNRIRIIPDASYRPVPLVPAINPGTGRALDMTYCTLRSVSPVHIEYMKNMETDSSMSVSILQSGRLWGLIACHHRTPKTVPFPLRGTCDLYARALALRLPVIDRAQDYARSIELKSIFNRLFAAMSGVTDFVSTLQVHQNDLLAFAASPGAAVVTESQVVLLGETPSEEQVRYLANWIFENSREEVFHSACLSKLVPGTGQLTATCSGLLAIAISKLHPSYVMWFRPEVIQTITWGGDPRKNVEEVGGQYKIQPRQSFETWKEIVRKRSVAWSLAELEAASDLRNAIVGIVLRRVEEVADLNKELTRSNRELEAFSYSVSHDLRAPLRHIAGYAEILRESLSDKLSERDQRFIDTIIESSEYAGKLVEKLLDYSRLGRAVLQYNDVDMNLLVHEIHTDLAPEMDGRSIAWRISDLPPIRADLVMLRMAVRDLMANAVKYTRLKSQAVIEIGGQQTNDSNIYWVKDNGVGFDMQYSDKLFGVFQRLHRWEDYEGTGIGLANVQRVMERHGGRAWADGQEGRGATFYFSLPKPMNQSESSHAETHPAGGGQPEGPGTDTARSGEEQSGE